MARVKTLNGRTVKDFIAGRPLNSDFPLEEFDLLHNEIDGYGLSNKEIADAFGCTLKEVKDRRKYQLLAFDVY